MGRPLSQVPKREGPGAPLHVRRPGRELVQASARGAAGTLPLVVLNFKIFAFRFARRLLGLSREDTFFTAAELAVGNKTFEEEFGGGDDHWSRGRTH